MPLTASVYHGALTVNFIIEQTNIRLGELAAV